jgi:hypothetical protein
VARPFTVEERMDSQVDQLRRLEAGTTAAAALAFFDSLPPVGVEELLGAWRGSGVPTGNPLDGLLESFGWHGKRFDGADEVHPLVFGKGDGTLFSVNPSFLPIGAVVRHAGLLHTHAAAKAFRLLRGVLSTRAPQARLRMTECRGVVSATMSYDRLPVDDHFRKVDDDTVLGVMDLRGMEVPFVFVLRRVAAER